jgi:DNA phosphorothioation-dependent restriction protein DptG
MDNEYLEQLKKKCGIDETIAKKYDKSVRKVEEDYDPHLLKLLQEYLKQISQPSGN